MLKQEQVFHLFPGLKAGSDFTTRIASASSSGSTPLRMLKLPGLRHPLLLHRTLQLLYPECCFFSNFRIIGIRTDKLRALHLHKSKYHRHLFHHNERNFFLFSFLNLFFYFSRNFSNLSIFYFGLSFVRCHKLNIVFRFN